MTRNSLFSAFRFQLLASAFGLSPRRHAVTAPSRSRLCKRCRARHSPLCTLHFFSFVSFVQFVDCIFPHVPATAPSRSRLSYRIRELGNTEPGIPARRNLRRASVFPGSLFLSSGFLSLSGSRRPLAHARGSVRGAGLASTSLLPIACCLIPSPPDQKSSRG